MSDTVVAREELWIALAEILGPRNASFRPLMECFGTPEAVFAADRAALVVRGCNIPRTIAVIKSKNLFISYVILIIFNKYR